MSDFASYFTDKKIIKLVAKYRIGVASKRHDIHILNGIRAKANVVDAVAATKHKIDEIILNIVPTRQHWVRFGREKRKGFDNSTRMNIARLEKAILFYRAKVKKKKVITIEPWYQELEKFLSEIRTILKNISAFHLTEPIILREKKDKEGKDYTPYRPIAYYKSLVDKIIIGQTAKYLTDNLDGDLCHSAVYAFRSSKNRAEPITHHDTVTRVQEYVREHLDTELWVTECDIKKFYDCVSHQAAKEALQDISARFEQRTTEKIDPRAFAVFEKYLDSYSFNYRVNHMNETEEMKRINGRFEWAEEELEKEFYPNGIKENIGVPQGGAISCLIANILLDKADRAILESSDKDLLYMRYCDDMILVHPDKAKCTEALNKYMLMLKDCKLLCHAPVPIDKYFKDFWSSKSKLPYSWGKKTDYKVPWMSFVGYQIRYDGHVRIRKKSLRKEIDKQKKIIEDIGYAIKVNDKKNLHLNSRRNSRQILHRAEQKLIAISVGRMTLRSTQSVGIRPSWTIGFKKLNRNPIVEKQLKALDRSRTRSMRNLQKNIKSLYIDNPGKPPKILERFFGSPFSYHNFIIKK